MGERGLYQQEVHGGRGDCTNKKYMGGGLIAPTGSAWGRGILLAVSFT